MTNPISHAATLFGAAKVAGKVAGKVIDQITPAGFDTLLGGGETESAAEKGESISVTELAERAVKAIQDRLAGFGISANPPLAIDVLPGGKAQVSEPHDQAAAIEAALAGDGELRQLLSQFYGASGHPHGQPLKLVVGSKDQHLTNSPSIETISGTSGGYANW